MRNWGGHLGSAVYGLGLLWAVLASSAPVAAQPPTPAGGDVAALVLVKTHELHNVWQLSGRVLSGSEPENDAAFAELVSLGIKTIVSVDGIAPRVAVAERHGLRYVHIPIGYDGVPVDAARALVRVAREIPGTIYVHCHHGKHRGPAAAAVLCRADDGRSAAGAQLILEKAGTGREYPGLWQSVVQFREPPPDADLPELTEHAQVESLAATMAKLDRIFARLETQLDRGGQPDTPLGQPSAAADAVQLYELFVEAARLTSNADLRQGLESAGQTAQELSGVSAEDRQSSRAQRLVNRLGQSCTACHRQHRN